MLPKELDEDNKNYRNEILRNEEVNKKITYCHKKVYTYICSVLASFQPSVVFYCDCQSFTDGQGGKAPFPHCPAVFTSSKSVNY